jgi:hypothetical protein
MNNSLPSNHLSALRADPSKERGAYLLSPSALLSSDNALAVAQARRYSKRLPTAQTARLLPRSPGMGLALAQTDESHRLGNQSHSSR